MTPIQVDPLLRQRPGLFPNQVPPRSDRETIQVGETVKVLVGIREVEQLPKGRWVIVTKRSVRSGSVFLVGNVIDPGTEEASLEFQPMHVYRMEPRLFMIWGSQGIPKALRGQASDDLDYHPPLDENGRALSACEELMFRFQSDGWTEARAYYEALRAGNESWPMAEDLK